MYKKIIDSHVHSDNSFDGHHSPMFLCEKAEELGLRALAVTDHIEIDYFRENNYQRTANQSHFETAKARSAFRGKLIVGVGVELGQPMYDRETADAFVKSKKYDFILAAVHNLRGKPDFMFLDYGVDKVEDVMEQYFKELQLVADWGNFDSLAHFTYPLRYIVGNHGIEVDLSKYSEEIDSILLSLVKNKKALEINTSGLRQALKRTMPGEDIVKRFKELGGEYITIGSDAHYANDLAAGIQEGMEIALRCGFECVSLYQGREPIQIPIE
ncbi:MAG: histidinol-phosphatase HisJ family protein [Acutalibacteraceae bacterium]|jgi:histidinol-phosphatase (PHP family)